MKVFKSWSQTAGGIHGYGLCRQGDSVLVPTLYSQASITIPRYESGKSTGHPSPGLPGLGILRPIAECDPTKMFLGPLH